MSLQINTLKRFFFLENIHRLKSNPLVPLFKKYLLLVVWRRLEL